MSISLNRVFMAGNITRDIDVKYSPSNTAIASFGLAVNEKRQGKDAVLFMDVTGFGKTAELVNEYCGKGDPVLVEGRLQMDQWEGRDGKPKSKLKMIAERVTFLAQGRTRGAGVGQDMGGGAESTQEPSSQQESVETGDEDNYPF